MDSLLCRLLTMSVSEVVMFNEILQPTVLGVGATFAGLSLLWLIAMGLRCLGGV